MNNDPIEDQLDDQMLEQMFMEMTPEQEAQKLLEEFAVFAGSLEKSLEHIPEEHKNVKEKVEKLVYALGGLGVADMLVLFDAMDKAHPDDGAEEEGRGF